MEIANLKKCLRKMRRRLYSLQDRAEEIETILDNYRRLYHFYQSRSNISDEANRRCIDDSLLRPRPSQEIANIFDWNTSYESQLRRSPRLDIHNRTVTREVFEHYIMEAFDRCMQKGQLRDAASIQEIIEEHGSTPYVCKQSV